MENMFLDQYTTINLPASAPRHGFAWRSSYTLMKGVHPVRIAGKVLYPGCFVTIPHHELLTERNAGKIEQFDLRSLTSPKNINRIVRICSIVRDDCSDSQRLICEVEPVLQFSELPSDLRTPERESLYNGATRLFLADFEWNKPLVDVDKIVEILDGIHPCYPRC